MRVALQYNVDRVLVEKLLVDLAHALVGLEVALSPYTVTINSLSSL